MTNNQNLALGTLIQQRRQQLGLSLSEVARRAGLDKGTLSLLERGKVSQPATGQPEQLGGGAGGASG